MTKSQLTEEEIKLYDRIVAGGDMENMFNFGYVIGRERMARELEAVLRERLNKIVEVKQ